MSFLNIISSKEENYKPIELSEFMVRFLKRYWQRTLWAIVCLFLSASIVLVLGEVLKNIVDFGFSKPDEIINSNFILLSIIVMLLAYTSYMRFYLVSWLSERLVTDLRISLFNGIMRTDFNFFENSSVSEIISKITTDLTLIQVIASTSAPIIIRNFIILLGSTLMMYYSNSFLTFMIFLMVPFNIIPIWIYGRKIRLLSAQSQEAISKFGSIAQSAITDIRTVLGFCKENAETTKFAQAVNESFDIAINRAQTRSILSSVVISIILISIWIVLGIGSKMLIKQNISAGELSSFVFYAALAASAVVGFTDVLSDINRATGAYSRILELVKKVDHIKNSTTHLIENIKGKIDFIDVNFSYDNSPETAVLNNFCLSIEPGEKIAFVGPSGTGKSTLISLLMGFHKAKSGKLLIDDIDISTIDVHQLRKSIGVVRQNPVIFQGTIRDNIIYGKLEADDEEIIRVSKAAYAHSFIKRLPKKYNTLVGEGGLKLSSGERQRIAIARLLLWNPSIILLDEATNALDAEIEREVYLALEGLMKNKTTLVMTHKSAITSIMDKVVVLDKGEIVAIGDHKTLWASCDIYRRYVGLYTE